MCVFIILSLLDAHMFLEISSIFRGNLNGTISLTFGYPTDRQIGRDTNFMAECGGQTRMR